jgi:hypothetical protein
MAVRWTKGAASQLYGWNLRAETGEERIRRVEVWAHLAGEMRCFDESITGYKSMR